MPSPSIATFVDLFLIYDNSSLSRYDICGGSAYGFTIGIASHSLEHEKISDILLVIAT
jgi:hypothetical protein